METIMRTLSLAGLAAVAAVAFSFPAMSQDTGTPTERPAQTADEVNAEAVPLPSTTTVIPGDTPDEPDLVIEEHHGNLTPPPPEEMNKSYPVCSAEVTDECRNPAETEGSPEASEHDHGLAEPAGR